MVEVRQVPHANQNTQTNIEAYHGAIKWWLKHDTRGTKARKVNWLVWRLTNLVSTHYLHVQRAKKEGFIQNHNAKKIVEDGILWARTITKGM
jgi:hypothetical protein